MLSFLKVFFRGLIITLLLPFILLVWVIYGVYCICIFIFMFFKSVIDYFRGKTFSSDLPEDLESRRMILEKEKADEQAKSMMSTMYQNVFGQVRTVTPESAEQTYQQENPYPYNPEHDFDNASTNEEETDQIDSEENEEPQDDLRSY